MRNSYCYRKWPLWRCAWPSLLLLALCSLTGGCESRNASALEGRVVGWNGEGLSGVVVTAHQIEPIKGYEKLEALADTDGFFRIEGLFPASQYRVRPSTDKWTTPATMRISSAPRGETAVLPAPLKVESAFSTSGGARVLDLLTGATRFIVSSEGVITDATSDLEWLPGPKLIYAEALQWVSRSQVAGGRWRLPTTDELQNLYEPGVTDWNLDPSFKPSGSSAVVWGEPYAQYARIFQFSFGHRSYDSRRTPHQVIAVRSSS